MSLHTKSEYHCGMAETGYSGFLGKDLMTKDLMGKNVIEFGLCSSHKLLHA